MQTELVTLLAGRRGHFRMESGYHSDAWYELERLFEPSAQLRPFVQELARRVAAHRIDAVCGPREGGARLARGIASELGVPEFVTERFETPGDARLFPVRYLLPAAQRAAVTGQRVAIVDDAISAGSAVRGTHADLLACGAKPVVVGALFIFGTAADAFAAAHGLALEGLARVNLGMWKPDECPLCRAGVPIERVSDT